MSKIDFQYLDSIRSSVCRACSKSDASGKCIASPGVECSLELYLPQVTKALESAHGGSVNEYMLSLRTEVCSVCKFKGETGYCYTSDSFGCPLESFFEMVASAAVKLDVA
ncbi:MAG TPA: hypothetical protein VIS48_16500 [Candidatus Kryptonia bacterium]